MTATAPATLVASLVKSGKETITAEIDEKNDKAATAVSRVFALVAEGKLDISVLDGLIAFAENPVEHARNSAPALAAGSSSDSKSANLDERAALEYLVNSPVFSVGEKKAIQAIVAPEGDPLKLRVDNEGKPAVVNTLQSQIATKTQELATANTEINRLTTDLATAQQTPKVAPDTMAKTEVFKVGDELNKIVGEGVVKHGSAKVISKGSIVLDPEATSKLAEQIKKIQTPKPAAS